MRTPNPRVQAKIFANRVKKQRELAEMHMRGIARGAKQAAKIAKEMIASGWTDMEKFEAEVWRRVRAGKK